MKLTKEEIRELVGPYREHAQKRLKAAAAAAAQLAEAARIIGDGLHMMRSLVDNPQIRIHVGDEVETRAFPNPPHRTRRGKR